MLIMIITGINKMDLFNEVDYDVIEFLKEAGEQGLTFEDIRCKLGKKPRRVYRCLLKLRKKNLMTMQKTVGSFFYIISGINETIKLIKVRCPICKTVKRIHKENQTNTSCLNPDCKMKSGAHRSFWLVNSDAWKRGSIIPINRVE